MRTIKDAITAGSIIPRNNNYYNSDDWFVNTAQHLDRLLSSTQGKRELFDDYTEDHAEIVDAIDDLFLFNAYKYRHLWTLYVAEYNPLWNVDGSEKIIRDRTNTGTQEDKLSGNDTLEYLGTMKDSHTGHDDLTKSGSESLARTGHDDVTQTGNIKEENGGNITSARTTFDSGTFLDTDKDSDTRSTTTTFNSKKDQTNYNSTDTTTFTSRKDEQSYLSDMTRSFTNRQDKTTFGKTNTRTDNLAEHEVEEHIRGGNIGVTMTTQLEEAEYKWAMMFKFLNIIVSDIANHIAYIW